MTPTPRAALLLVDIQQGLDDPKWGARNNPNAEQRDRARCSPRGGAQWPVIHIQTCRSDRSSPLRPNLPGNAFKPGSDAARGRAGVSEDREQRLHRHAARGPFVARRDPLAGASVGPPPTIASRRRFAWPAISASMSSSSRTPRRRSKRTGPDGARYSADQMHRIAAGEPARRVRPRAISARRATRLFTSTDAWPRRRHEPDFEIGDGAVDVLHLNADCFSGITTTSPAATWRLTPPWFPPRRRPPSDGRWCRR